MKKMPCLFQRDFTDPRNPILLPIVTPGCEWALSGDGIATRKWDGTAVAIIGGKLHARYDAKRGKPLPPGAIPCGEPDPVTGHNPAWVLADRPEDRWIREALTNTGTTIDGTYEAVGPKINGNHECVSTHRLVMHGGAIYTLSKDDLTFDGMRVWLKFHSIEGLVFHHSDGRMCKIRRDDYEIAWPVV